MPVDSQGQYVFRGIAPGTYMMRARSSRYQNEVYSGFPCDALEISSCLNFTPITINRDGTDTRIDFSLLPLARLNVTITNSFAEVLGQRLRAMNPAGIFLRDYQISPVTGTFVVTINDVPLSPTIYGLQSTSYFSQLFDHVNCAGNDPQFTDCPFASAIPLVLAPQQTGAIRFTPRAFNSRAVRVRDATSAAPLANVAIDVWKDPGIRVGSFFTNTEGIAWLNTVPTLPAPHVIATDNRQGYLDQVHAGINCPNGSAFLGLCSLSGATPISLPAPDNNQPTIEFLLQRETPLFRSGFEPSN